MAAQVKKFEFLPFDKWYDKRYYYEETIGNYKVEIKSFFEYYVVFDNFKLEHIKWFKFDEEMSEEEQLESLKAWYEESCSKINEGFEKYIRAHHFVEN